MNKQLKTVGYDKEIQPGELSSQLQWILDRFGSAIKPTGLMVDLALRNGETVLLEGAQGALLDIDQGTYPFVTSSVVGRANATHGAGIHPGHITECFGITKAYCTRVGMDLSLVNFRSKKGRGNIWPKSGMNLVRLPGVLGELVGST